MASDYPFVRSLRLHYSLSMESPQEEDQKQNKPRFLKRQFSSEYRVRITTVVDVTAGIFIPILLFLFDPVLFPRPGNCIGGISALSLVSFFVRTSVGLGMIVLALWLLKEAEWEQYAAIFAGVLFTGGFFATGMGLALLPYSLLGLIMCIGILGFFPFVTAFVYFRNAAYALKIARAHIKNTFYLVIVMITCGLTIVTLPALGQWGLTVTVFNAIDEIVTAPQSEEAENAVSRLRTINTVCLGLCTDTISYAFYTAQYTTRDQREVLSEAHRRITGRSSYGCGTASQ